MMYKQTIVGLSVYGQQPGGTATQGKRPLAPRPSLSIDGGVAQNFRTKASQRYSVTTSKRCTDCDDGWIRQPDGYGCVEWTLCYRCGGTGEQKDD